MSERLKQLQAELDALPDTGTDRERLLLTAAKLMGTLMVAIDYSDGDARNKELLAKTAENVSNISSGLGPGHPATLILMRMLLIALFITVNGREPTDADLEV